MNTQSVVAPGNRQALIELEKQTFSIAFEMALEHMGDGKPLSEFCSTYHIPLSPVRFRTWMFQDKKRRQAYAVAKALGAEALEDDIIRLSDGKMADGSPSPDDVMRNKLQVDTRKWLMQVNNRKRYGEVKHVQQTTTTVGITGLSTVELEQRLLRSLGLGEDSSIVVGELVDIEEEDVTAD